MNLLIELHVLTRETVETLHAAAQTQDARRCLGWGVVPQCSIITVRNTGLSTRTTPPPVEFADARILWINSRLTCVLPKPFQIPPGKLRQIEQTIAVEQGYDQNEWTVRRIALERKYSSCWGSSWGSITDLERVGHESKS